MNTRGFLGLIMLAALAGCPKPVPPPVNPTPDAADAAPAVCTAAADVCAYCAHMRALRCPEGQATPKGASCEDVTTNVQSLDYARMDLACRTKAGSCAAPGCK